MQHLLFTCWLFIDDTALFQHSSLPVKPSSAIQWAHFSCLCLQTPSFSHYPKSMTLSYALNVNWLLNHISPPHHARYHWCCPKPPDTWPQMLTQARRISQNHSHLGRGHACLRRQEECCLLRRQETFGTVLQFQSLINVTDFANTESVFSFFPFLISPVQMLCTLHHRQGYILILLYVCGSWKWQQKGDQRWQRNQGEGRSKSSHQRGEFSKLIWSCQIQTAALLLPAVTTGNDLSSSRLPFKCGFINQLHNVFS